MYLLELNLVLYLCVYFRVFLQFFYGMIWQIIGYLGEFGIFCVQINVSLLQGMIFNRYWGILIGIMLCQNFFFFLLDISCVEFYFI